MVLIQRGKVQLRLQIFLRNKQWKVGTVEGRKTFEPWIIIVDKHFVVLVICLDTKDAVMGK